VAIARLDHMTKHVFIIPGIILAHVLRDPAQETRLVTLVLGLLSAIAIASANYVINEWLDREFDAYHPLKSARTAVHRSLSAPIVYAEYLLLVIIGLSLALQLGPLFAWTSLAFVASGLIYNVAPIRTKDRVYLDVISESINNPIRLMLGWTMVEPYSRAPASLLLAYWMGGAFLMAAKRLAEYRDISAAGGADMLPRYRRSFGHYTAENLSVSCLLYAMLSAFFLAVFLMQYRQEYMLALPFIAILFASYFWLAMRRDSVASRPERLFRSRRLMTASAVVVIALTALSFIDIPGLNDLSAPAQVRRQL
jgi:4-hydroxybenzoate polyprenyltransferase